MRDEDHLLPVASARWRKLNGAPQGAGDDVDKAWGWLTVEILMSDAYRALTAPAFKVLARMWIEHISHAGGENGMLIVTYEDFVRYGVRRSSIRQAIDSLVELGLVDVTVKGRAGEGIGRMAARYRLTWLPMRDGAPATNRWKIYTAPAPKRKPPPRRAPSRSLDSSTICETKKTSMQSTVRSGVGTASGTGPSPASVTRENEMHEASDAA